MTADPITVHAELMAVEAIQKMEHNRRKPISVLPVVNAEGNWKAYCVSTTWCRQGSPNDPAAEITAMAAKTPRSARH